jgi:hypothetical protein
MSTFTICQEISEGKDEKILSFLLSPDVTKLATKEQIYDFLRTVIDWKLVFSGLASWQDDYNSLDDRFLKASLMGYLIQISSSGRIKYINEKGCDFFIPELNIGLEMKGFKDTMFNSRGDRTKELKIKNTQGNKSGYDVDLEKTFNYLMILCPGYAGLSTFERTKERSYPKADGVYAVLDFNDIDIIKKSEKFVKSKINITDIKTKILIAAVEELKRVVENETI